MSLFKLKALWTNSYLEEEFDEQHLAVGKLGRFACFALGSFKGVLRVLSVGRSSMLTVNSVYQTKLEDPIIDVKFVNHPNEANRNTTIGVLQFRKFIYLSLEQTGVSEYEPKMLVVDVEPAFAIGVRPICVLTLNSAVQYLNPYQVQKIKVGDPIYPFALALTKIYFMDGEELVEIDGSTEQWRVIVGRVRQLFVLGETVIVIGERALW